MLFQAETKTLDFLYKLCCQSIIPILVIIFWIESIWIAKIYYSTNELEQIATTYSKQIITKSL